MKNLEQDEKEVARIRKKISRIGCIGNGGHDFSKGLRLVKARDWDTISIKEKNEFIHENFDKIFNYRPSWFDNEFSCSDYRPNIDMDSIEFTKLKEFILSRDDIDYDPILEEIKELDEKITEGMNPYGYTVPTIQDFIITACFPNFIKEKIKKENDEYKEYMLSDGFKEWKARTEHLLIKPIRESF